MNIMCPNEGCSGNLKQDDVDSRQEWVTIYMHCPECKEEFVYREDYHLQSSRIASQTLTDSKGKEREF